MMPIICPGCKKLRMQTPCEVCALGNVDLREAERIQIWKYWKD